MASEKEQMIDVMNKLSKAIANKDDLPVIAETVATVKGAFAAIEDRSSLFLFTQIDEAINEGLEVAKAAMPDATTD